jgi:hypothetical protein
LQGGAVSFHDGDPGLFIGAAPVFSLSKPVADFQRPRKAIVEKEAPPVHERRCVLREMS